jgi:AraC-like DNA-binding protein
MFVFPRTAVWIQHEGCAPFVADPNGVTFYNPGQRYTRRELSPDGDRADWYVVSPETMVEAAARFDAATVDRPEAPLPFSHGPSSARAYVGQRCLFEYVARTAQPDRLLVEEAVLLALQRVLALAFARCHGERRRPGSAAAARRRDVAERAKAMLATRFHEGLSLRGLAGELGVSPFHLARVFRAHAGITLHEHQTRLRLAGALERLADPRADLLQVALDTGFSSHSHFTSAFVRRFGVTPSELRRSVASGALREMARAISRGPDRSSDA